VPLLGAEIGLGASRPRRSGTGIAAARIDEEGARAKSLLAAQARTALRAVDLSAELGRRSERLLAVAPKLRAWHPTLLSKGFCPTTQSSLQRRSPV
jgi:hypothetical protein